MSPIHPSYLTAFWSQPVMEVNLLVLLNLLGALALGMLVGYERAYHGRAAGMRTYGMVCMASAALTVFSGYPGFWWGGGGHGLPAVDPTRVVQGIVTGVGFLGAGVIMRDGLNISGLATAASIWASSAIGVLVGIGFYAAAVMLAVISASLMRWGPAVESLLPSRRAIGVSMGFDLGHTPDEATIRASLQQLGYELSEGTLTIKTHDNECHLNFLMASTGRQTGHRSLFEVSRGLRQLSGIRSVQVSHARN